MFWFYIDSYCFVIVTKYVTALPKIDKLIWLEERNRNTEI
jgi:hypothetical protein